MIEKASEIFGLKEKYLRVFEEKDPFNDKVLSGVISVFPDHRYGSLLLLKINEEEIQQYIPCTPKLHYPFDKEGNYNWPSINELVVHDKLDGTNILAYSYLYEGKQFFTYKTRLTPVLKDLTFGSFLSLWKEYLEDNSWVEQVIKFNHDYNLSFGLFGARNKHLVDYEVPLEVNLLFGIHRQFGLIVPPKELTTFENTKIAKKVVCKNPSDLTNFYNSLRKGMSDVIQQNENFQLEGMVLYANVENTWKMFKVKPEEVEKIHWASSGAIPKKAIFTTAINAYENEDDPSLEFLIELLEEEFEKDHITRSRKRIENIHKEAKEYMEFTRRVNEVWFKAKQEGFDITKDKEQTLRFVSQFFDKKEMRKVGSIILKQVGLI